jgi:selenocysteine-specific elongation factor
LVALTKCDLVNDEAIARVRDQIAEAVAGTFLEGAPVVDVSAKTETGLDDLRKTLVQLAQRVPPRNSRGLLRLPLDRVFTMKGFGTVVTGTLHSGTVRVGDDVVVLPSNLRAKVRGLEVHNQSVQEATAGQRTAVNLQGLDKTQIARGDMLARPDTLRATAIVDAVLRYLPVSQTPLKQRERLLFHIGTTHAMATTIVLGGSKIEPGAEGYVQFHLEKPLVALPGDRFIARGFAAQEHHGTTVAGGEILSVAPRKLRRADARIMTELQAMRQAAPAQRLEMEVRAAGLAGLTRQQLGARLPFAAHEMDDHLRALGDQGTVTAIDRDMFVHGEPIARLRKQIQEVVERFHAEQPRRAGIAREELRTRLAGDGETSPKLFQWAIDSMVGQGDLAVDRELVRRPSHRVDVHTEKLAPLRQSVADALAKAGLSPPRPAELAADLKATERDVLDTLRLLQAEKSVVKVTDFYFSQARIEEVRALLLAFLQRHGQITAQQWKDLCGVTRKYAIPIAEHFDAEKLTVRVGEVRKLRGRA